MAQRKRKRYSSQKFPTHSSLIAVDSRHSKTAKMADIPGVSAESVEIKKRRPQMYGKVQKKRNF